jgi:hypothetical protein
MKIDKVSMWMKGVCILFLSTGFIVGSMIVADYNPGAERLPLSGDTKFSLMMFNSLMAILVGALTHSLAIDLSNKV